MHYMKLPPLVLLAIHLMRAGNNRRRVTSRRRSSVSPLTPCYQTSLLFLVRSSPMSRCACPNTEPSRRAPTAVGTDDQLWCAFLACRFTSHRCKDRCGGGDSVVDDCFRSCRYSDAAIARSGDLTHLGVCYSAPSARGQRACVTCRAGFKTFEAGPEQLWNTILRIEITLKWRRAAMPPVCLRSCCQSWMLTATRSGRISGTQDARCDRAASCSQSHPLRADGCDRRWRVRPWR